MNQKKKPAVFFEKGFLTILFAFFAPVFIALALSSHWTRSELFAVHTARLIFTESSRDFLFSLKPLYNLFLFLSFKISAALGVLPLTAARVFSAGIGCGAAFCAWFLIRKRAGAFFAALALLILIGSPIFLERGFRVRSDMAAALWILAGLSVKLSGGKAGERGGQWTFLPFTALFITPKSLYILAASLPLFRLLCKRAGKKPPPTTTGGGLRHGGREVFRRAGRKTNKGRLGMQAAAEGGFRLAGALFNRAAGAGAGLLKQKPAVSAVLFLFCTSFLFHDLFFLKAIKESALFYLHSLQEIRGPSKTWFFLFRFALKNPVLSSLIPLKAFFVLRRGFSRRRAENYRVNAGDAAFLILCFALFFHPFPKPFFIVSLQPFFLLAFFLDPSLKAWRPSRALRLFLLSAFSLCAVWTAACHLNFTFRHNNNFLQKEAVQKLNLLAEAQVQNGQTIYDPQAFVYKKTPHLFQWFNRGRENCRRFLQKSADIDVIYSLPCPDLFEFLRYKKAGVFWTNIGAHIYYKSCHIDISLLQGRKGSKILKACEASGSWGGRGKAQIQERVYWHVFLNENKKPLLKKQSGPTSAPKSAPTSAEAQTLSHKTDFEKQSSGCKQTLCPQIMYSKEEFLNGVFSKEPAPEGAKEAAFFFFPPPDRISEARPVANRISEARPVADRISADGAEADRILPETRFGQAGSKDRKAEARPAADGLILPEKTKLNELLRYDIL